jgi:hypothetical protein
MAGLKIEDLTNEELLSECESCIREIQNRGLEVPQVDKY